MRSRRGPTRLAWLAILLTACSSADRGTRGDDTPPTEGPAAPTANLVVALSPGTVLRVAPVAQTDGGEVDGFDRIVFDGLLRESLRQSRRLDVAAGTEDQPTAANTLEIRFDPNARVTTTTLRTARAERPAAPLPLVEVPFRAPLTAHVDAVAAAVRTALGDPPSAARGDALAAAELYSADERCVRLTERGLRAFAGRDLAIARGTLEQARQSDPGCTVALAALANLALAIGDATTAEKVANTTLTHLGLRLAPTTQHRLARVLLLARATRGDRGTARSQDELLRQLGEAGARDRPHDPHPRYTRALALGYLGRFEESRPLLAALAERWPKQGWVAYHLAFAELAAGDADAALARLDDARRLLPTEAVAMPRALALFDAGRHDELDRYLSRLTDDVRRRERRDGEANSGDALHRLLRVQAAHALLTDRPDAARRALLEDLEWLRQRPSRLDTLALDVAAAGEVLIRLGSLAELEPFLDALRRVPGRTSALPQALAFLAGLILIERDGAAPEAALRHLEQSNRQVWSTVLRAALHRRRGEVVDETRELATAVRMTDDPLVQASFARALQTLGRRDAAAKLTTDLRTRLRRLDLRAPLDHPLFDPVRALAWTEIGT